MFISDCMSSRESPRLRVRYPESNLMLTIHYLAAVPKAASDRIKSSQHKEYVGHQLMLAREAVGLIKPKWLGSYGMSPNKLNQWRTWALLSGTLVSKKLMR